MNKDPKLFPEEVRECWAVHQVFRSLGFSPDNIYVMLAKDAALLEENSSLFVLLRSGTNEFAVTLANYNSEEEAKSVMGIWTEFANLSNSRAFDQKTMDEIFDNSHIVRNKVELLLALRDKGFLPGPGSN